MTQADALFSGPQAPGLQAHPYMVRRLKRVGRAFAYQATSIEAHRAWRRKVIAHLKRITGYDTMEACPLKPRITESVPCDGYTRQRVEIQTEPGVVMPMYVLIPDAVGENARRKQRLPAVICPHGHGSGGKLSPAGMIQFPVIKQAVEKYNYDYGVKFAQAGMVAFCPDARGFGERQEKFVRETANALHHSCLHLNQMGIPLGQTVTGMWAWEIHRLVKYIQTRRDVDSDRIGCAGLSGGGLQTLWAMALDDRNLIKAGVVSGYFYGIKESLLDEHRHCSCNYVPGLFQAVDMGDLGALVAPRPLVVETGSSDPLNGESGLKNVKSQVAVARRAYRLLGAGKNLVHDVFDGGHRWNGTVAIPFLKAALGLNSVGRT